MLSEKLTAPTVAVVGGGVAGIAASCALAEAGYAVTLFERRAFLGGRACSYLHPSVGEVIDNCPHVLLGCCTNLIDLLRRLGVRDQIRWSSRIVFAEPGGRQGVLEASRLPAPLHSSWAFLRYPLLGVADKLTIARALLALLRPVAESDESFLVWLRRHGQTERSIRRFWEPVLVGSLNEELDRCSLQYSAMVFRQAFLNSAEAGRMGVSRLPLSELYGAAEHCLAAHGSCVRWRAKVESLEGVDDGVVVQVDGERRHFDYAISAVPQRALLALLPDGAEKSRISAAQLEPVPISAIHLWFDRPITPLAHVALLERTIQWVFQRPTGDAPKSTFINKAEKSSGSHLELVVSASRSLLRLPRAEILALALRELAEFFPAVHEAQLVKSAIVKEVHATFAPTPRSDRHRLAPQTGWPRLFLGGDWTASGWPATMEGAARSGYLAAEALCQSAGRPQRFLIDDLAPRGLMRLLTSKARRA